MTYSLEKRLPLIVSLICVAVAFFFYQPYVRISSEYFSSLQTLSITISAIIIGFFTSALSILIVLNETLLIKELIKNDIYDRIINIFSEAIFLGFIILIVNIIFYLLLDARTTNKIICYILHFRYLVFIFMLSYFLTKSYYGVYILLSIVRTKTSRTK